MSFQRRKPSSSSSSQAHTNDKDSSHGPILEEVAEVIEEKIEQALLVLWDDLPHWQRDNQYIRSGYRQASSSIKKSIHSLGYLHNESVNIYSHLVGALLFVVTAIVLYGELLKPRYDTASRADVLAFGCFFAGTAVCLGMSAAYHTISNHSSAVARLGNKLDYIGIVVLIWGSFVASIYYGFYCRARLQLVYWAMISVLAVACSAVSIVPRFRTPEWRPYRAGMFVAMGLSAIFPVLQGMQLYGVNKLKDQIGLYWLVGQGALYILGAGIYAARVPERLYPGKFDIWGSSHQIFHVLVVLAAASHLLGLIRAFGYNHGPLSPGCSVE
ncbi:MAG: hypothetical protein M1816_006006 [Peltula sp. TS41687]|nr:MAG: hypothetical protein M1816_006006 [Peltula sp. TS41687]